MVAGRFAQRIQAAAAAGATIVAPAAFPQVNYCTSSVNAHMLVWTVHSSQHHAGKWCFLTLLHICIVRLFDPPPDKRPPGRQQSRGTAIPASYVYSPSLVPRPCDWPDHVQVWVPAMSHDLFNCEHSYLLPP